MEIDEFEVTEYLGEINLSLSPHYCIENHILRNGVWESHVVEILSLILKEGDVCVDVGANSGIHSLFMARTVGETGKVISFEPSPEYASRFTKQVEKNTGLRSRIELIRCGVAENSGRLKLFESGEIAGNAYLAPEYNPEMWNRFGPEKFTEVEVITLDEALDGRAVSTIKIDVEGMEVEVLRGAKDTLARYKPNLVYETLVHCFSAEKLLAMQSFVADAGYYTYFRHPLVKKFVRCDYPHFPEDVVALHSSRLFEYRHLIHNRKVYRFGDEATKDMFGSEMLFDIVGVSDTSYFVGFYSADESLVEYQHVETTEGYFQFTWSTLHGTVLFTGWVFKIEESTLFTTNDIALRSSGGQVLRGNSEEGSLYLLRFQP